MESARLSFLPFKYGDEEEMMDLNSNPEVVRYTGDSAFSNKQEATTVIEYLLEQYERFGYGRMAVYLKENNEFIGFCGLKYHPETGETDLGYRLKRTYWSKGLATEAAMFFLNWGFNKLNLKVIVGRVAKDNLASIRVLQKIGMKKLREEDCGHHPGIIFSINKSDFIQLNNFL